jgi:hypothetical protein
MATFAAKNSKQHTQKRRMESQARAALAAMPSLSEEMRGRCRAPLALAISVMTESRGERAGGQFEEFWREAVFRVYNKYSSHGFDCPEDMLESDEPEARMVRMGKSKARQEFEQDSRESAYLDAAQTAALTNYIVAVVQNSGSVDLQKVRNDYRKALHAVSDAFGLRMETVNRDGYGYAKKGKNFADVVIRNEKGADPFPLPAGQAAARTAGQTGSFALAATDFPPLKKI